MKIYILIYEPIWNLWGHECTNVLFHTPNQWINTYVLHSSSDFGRKIKPVLSSLRWWLLGDPHVAVLFDGYQPLCINFGDERQCNIFQRPISAIFEYMVLHVFRDQKNRCGQLLNHMGKKLTVKSVWNIKMLRRTMFTQDCHWLFITSFMYTINKTIDQINVFLLTHKLYQYQKYLPFDTLFDIFKWKFSKEWTFN